MTKSNRVGAAAFGPLLMALVLVATFRLPPGAAGPKNPPPPGEQLFLSCTFFHPIPCIWWDIPDSSGDILVGSNWIRSPTCEAPGPASQAVFQGCGARLSACRRASARRAGDALPAWTFDRAAIQVGDITSRSATGEVRCRYEEGSLRRRRFLLYSRSSGGPLCVGSCSPPS